jgi:putative polyhydroxyalkanoate system protein
MDDERLQQGRTLTPLVRSGRYGAFVFWRVVGGVGLYENVAHLRKLGANGTLNVVDRFFDLLERHPGREVHFHCEQHFFWAAVHGQQLSDANHAIHCECECFDALTILRRRALTYEEAVRFPREKVRNAAQKQTDRQRGHTIPPCPTCQVTEAKAYQRDEQADERGRVFHQHHWDGGIFGEHHGAQRALVAFGFSKFPKRHTERIGFEQERGAEHDVAPQFAPAVLVRASVHLEQRVHTFVGGKGTAHRKQQNRYDEGPKIFLGRATKRMFLRGRAFTELHTKQEQSLVAGVCNAVHGFRQRTGTAADERSDELGDGDEQIAGESGDDDFEVVRGDGHGSALADSQRSRYRSGMADIHIVEKHTHTPEEAKRRVQSFEDQMEKWRLKAHWTGVNAELKGTGASGTISITGSEVKVEIKLGFLAKAAGIDAKRAQESIQKRLRGALDQA